MPKILMLFLTVSILAGCGDNGKYLTEERKALGLVVILPGIEGESPLNRNIRKGLMQAGMECAMPIYHWGRPIPLAGIVLNQVDFIGNRLAGVSIAKMITRYQDDYPGKPVYIVGHSGGGGVAVFAAEAMPAGRQVDGLVLLSASISSGYNLNKALSRCKNGIANFYNKGDVGLLGVGTTIAGNVDGMRGPSAGLIGFDPPSARASADDRQAYGKLFQVPLADITSGGDPHTSSTEAPFVSRYIAPWIIAQTWPAMASEMFIWTTASRR